MGTLLRLGPVGTLLPDKDWTGLFPTVPRGELLSVVAVPFPRSGRDPAITQLPAEGLEGECSDVVYKTVTEHGGRSVPEVVKTAAVVAMVGLDEMPMGEECGKSVWSGIFVINLRQLMACLFTMMVICVIRINRIGVIRMILHVRNMWNSIILTPLKEWN